MDNIYTLILFQSGDMNTIDVYNFTKFDQAKQIMDAIGEKLYQHFNQTHPEQPAAKVIEIDHTEIHNSANPRLKYVNLQIVNTPLDVDNDKILKDLKPMY